MSDLTFWTLVAPVVLLDAHQRAYAAEQLAGIAPPVMQPDPNPERLHEITPAPWANGHEGSEL